MQQTQGILGGQVCPDVAVNSRHPKDLVLEGPAQEDQRRAVVNLRTGRPQTNVGVEKDLSVH